MFVSNKIFVASFISLLDLVACLNETLQTVHIEKKTKDVDPATAVVLTQLNITQTDEGHTIYTYKCAAGTHNSNKLACSGEDITFWTSMHNVQLYLRCPDKGPGLILTYVDIIIAVSSPSVHCFINEGAVGSDSLGVTVNVWNSKYFAYSVNFYTA